MKNRTVLVVGTAIRILMAVCAIMGLYSIWWQQQGGGATASGLSTGTSVLFLIFLGVDGYLRKHFGWKDPKTLKITILIVGIIAVTVFCASMVKGNV